MELNRRQGLLLIAFIVLSLLLHLLALQILPGKRLFQVPPRREPVVVEVRPPQTPPSVKERELDLPSPEKEQIRETPAKRLGPSDQVAERERAPKGDAPEDRRPDAPVTPAPVPKQAQTASPRQPSAPPRTEAVPRQVPRPAERAARPDRTGPHPQSQPPETAQTPPAPPTPAVPNIQSLLELPETTVARLEEQWRQKYRKDVEEGDAVWLDTEKDILISFFQRFRNGVYGVWNYPVRSAERGEEGTCLLRITVTRAGKVQEVKVMEGSGFPALDQEAVEAVRKGAPYGDLPRAYKGEVLNIFAFFQYNLSRRIIY